MANYHVTIEGVERPLLLRSFEIRESINRVAVLNGEVESDDASYRPAVDDEILVTEDEGSPVTTIFGGVIDEPEERGFVGPNDDSIVTRINAAAFSSYADRRYVNETLAAGTLKSQLETLEPYLTEYGVTLDGAQADGPTMPAYDAAYRKLTDILNDLSHISIGAGGSPSQPYVWEVDHNKVLRMFQIGDEVAPFNLIEGDGVEHGDLVITTTRRNYCNRLILRSSSGDRTTIAEDTDEQTAHGLWEMAIETPAELTAEVAEQAADGLLREFNFVQTEARFSTLSLGFRPGQTITITSARRNVDAQFLITEVVSRVAPESNELIREVTAVLGYRLGGSWMDILARWGRGVGGIGIVGSGGGGTSSGGSGVRGNGTTTTVEDVTADASDVDQSLDLMATVTGSAVDEGDLTFRVTGPSPATTQVGLTRRVPVLAAISAGTLGQILTRTLGALDLTQSWTMVLRARVTGTLTAGQHQTIVLLGSRDFTGPYVWIGRRYGDTGLVCEVNDGSPVTRTAEAPITIGLMPLALRYTATSPPALEFIAHGVVVESVAVELSDLGSPSLWEDQALCGDEDSARPNVSVCQERTWQDVLTLVEISAEQRARQAVRTADLISDSPLSEANDLGDIAGGNDWTASGTLSTVGGFATSKWTLPGGSDAGDYTITGTYLGSARYRPSVGYGALTVNAGAFVFAQNGVWLFVDRAGTELADPSNAPNDTDRDLYRGGLASLASGYYFAASRTPSNRVDVYGPTLTVAGSQSFTPSGAASNYSDAFFTKKGTTDLVKIDTSGAIVQTWTGVVPSGVDAIAVAPDESFAYFGDNALSAVKQYDLVGAGGLTTLYDEGAGFEMEFGGMVLTTLQDGHILAAFSGTATDDLFVNVISSAGTLVRRDDIGPQTPSCFIQAIQAGLDETTYLVWWFDNDASQSVMTEVRVSDGVATELFRKPLVGGTIDWDDSVFTVARNGVPA